MRSVVSPFPFPFPPTFNPIPSHHAVLLSGAIQLTRYPPNAYPPVSVREEYHHEAGGRFVQLSRGRTHYELQEPPAGEAAQELPPVVLLHGVSGGGRGRR